ncbi:olfactory receptor 14A16-like [Sarcoramphus papa]
MGTQFLLLGFSDSCELQIFHSLVLLLFYLAALTGSVLIITVVVLDHQLHSPMYFFPMNPSISDLGSISVLVLKSMANSILNTRSISYSGYVAQVFFFLFFTPADFAILTVTVYDRYVTVGNPLHCETKMNKRACLQMALTFCRCNVNQFFCDVSQLFHMSCSDKYVHEFGAVVFSLCLFSICFMSILASYVQISLAVLRIPSEEGQHKASSTCLPHLTVASLFSCMGSTAYMKPISTFSSALAPVIAVLCSVLPPMISPAIYSMKNKDIKGATRKLIKRKL